MSGECRVNVVGLFRIYAYTYPGDFYDQRAIN